MMKRTQLTFIFTGLFLMLFFTVTAAGQEPILVKLTIFDTDFNSSTYKMEIRWETESEADVAGFHIYRSTSSTQLGQRVNSSLILAQGSASEGASYLFIDEPPNSGRYYYQLAELSLSTGSQSYHRPSVDNDGEPDYDDFIKAYIDQQAVEGGYFYWFNDGSAGHPGDGRKISLIVNAPGVTGQITVKQVNQEPPDAPNGFVCPWRWELSSNVAANAMIDFYYNDADVSGTPETRDYIGIAQYSEAAKTWRWLGGSVTASQNKVTVNGIYPSGYFALYRRIFGDISGDGYVDLSDYQKFGDVWNQTSTGEFPAGSDARFFNYSKTTVNGKQIINLDDFQVFGDNWHNGTPK